MDGKPKNPAAVALGQLAYAKKTPEERAEFERRRLAALANRTKQERAAASRKGWRSRRWWKAPTPTLTPQEDATSATSTPTASPHKSELLNQNAAVLEVPAAAAASLVQPDTAGSLQEQIALMMEALESMPDEALADMASAISGKFATE